MAIHAIDDRMSVILTRDWHRRLFDELIPLPDGTSYNAYLVRGREKTALIDAADPRLRREFLADLEALGVKRLDYVVSNHGEQDHSGCIPDVLARHPEATALATPRGAEFLRDLLLLPADRVRGVADGETVSLGDITLEFLHAPWVHWPETMLTYVPERRSLFSCDLFGSHLATSAPYADDRPRVREAAKRYYGEIMMPFRKNIVRHLQRLAAKEIALIAPSHGPMHRDPSFITEAYADWVSDRVSNEVVIPFVSMHGSVAAMVERLSARLEAGGAAVLPFNLPATDIGALAIALVDAATLIAGTPTVLGGPHPACSTALTLAGALRPKTRFVSFVGSYSWATRLADQVPAMLSGLKAKVLPPVIARGYPKPADCGLIDELADTVCTEHRAAGILR